MQSYKSCSRLAALTTIGLLIGVAISCEASLLFLGPDSNDELIDTVAPTSSPESEPNTQDLSSSGEVSSTSVPASSTVSSLEDVLRIKSLSEQQIALHIFLSELNEAQVDDLLTQSQDVFPETHRYELQFAIVQRLAHLNPSRALSRVLDMYTDHEYMRAVTNVFREWAHSNLNEAVSRARTLDQIPKGLALSAIVHTRLDLSESTLRAIALDLGNEQVAISAIAQRRIEESMGDPEKAWNEGAIRLQEEAANTEEIARIGMAWVEQSGLGVLDQIYQSLTNTETRQHVIRRLLEEIAQSDPAGAFKFALTIENDPYNSIFRELLDNWANSDPRSALSAVAGIETVEVRKVLADSIVRGWARSRPEEMFEALEALPAEFQEQAAKAAIFWMSSEARDQAAQLVVAMESGALKTSSARTVAEYWSSHGDPWRALDWILDEPGFHETRSELLSSIIQDLAKADPELAMSTALAQPIDENNTGFTEFGMFGEGLGMEYSVISSLASWNLDKAIELLPQVREGPTKSFAITTIAQVLIGNDEFDAAFELAHEVPEGFQQSFYIGLSTYWVLTDPVAALDSIDRFPLDEVKSQMALMLLTIDRNQKSLSDEQVEEAKQYLSDDQLKALEEGDSEKLPLIFQKP